MKVSLKINNNDWHHIAVFLFNNDTKRVIENNNRKLKTAFDKSHKPIVIDNKLKTELIQNFKLLLTSNNPSMIRFFDSKKKARLLAILLLTDEELADIDLMYSAPTIVNIFGKYPSIRLAPYILKILVKNYRSDNYDMYFDLLKNIVEEYKGNSLSILRIKNNIFLFHHEYGTTIATNLCIKLQISLIKFIQSIGLSDNLNSKYTASLLIELTKYHYDQNSLEDHFYEFMDFGNNYVEHDSIKLFYSYLVVYIDENKLVDEKDSVYKKAVDKVGDPVNASNWYLSNASNEKNDLLLKARRALNLWLNQFLLELFFDKLTFDSIRKNFWLRYKDLIPDIKIAVPYHIKRRLNLDKELDGFMKGRIKILQNGSGDESILLMKTKTHLLVESTVIGTAFYSYKLKGLNCPNTDWQYVNKSDLINTKMPTLFRNQYYTIYDIESEGRRAHVPSDSWPDLLGFWIDKYGGIN